jgi:hypothetical protein
MAIRSETLTLGRRLHDALRHAIEDDETYAGGRVTRSHFEHYACSMYLAGTLAFIEGKYGKNAWRKSANRAGLDEFLATKDDKRKTTLHRAGISEAGLHALVCIRNAVVHNDADLARNNDRRSIRKVSSASLPGVQLDGSTVRLRSTNSEDFMEYVRKSFVAVSMLHGDL